MELITEKTTIEEFTSEDNWLIEDPKTGAIYQMRAAVLHGGEWYLYVIQSGEMQCPVYVRHLHMGSVIIAPKEALLRTLVRKQFSVVFY
ncbi:MAG: hypothetical protein KAJ19_19620 [Gammaproteobacteria bacterium]|nr:hypothetical protein [Gammaproteobacteria bacterium]